MSQFFSCVSDGKGKVYYQDAEVRRRIKEGELDYIADSHTSIAAQHGFYDAAEDLFNKWEYNPLAGKFTADQINTTDDHDAVEKFCRELDWSTVAPELIIKPIVHPFRDRHTESVTKDDLMLLRQWISVHDLACKSVWDSVRDLVGKSVGYLVYNSVWNSVWDSVWDLVWNRVPNLEWNLVEWSVRNSTWAYMGSFFKLPKWKYVHHRSKEYPFQAGADLWERGLVPSYDDKRWRLHGYRGKALWAGTPDEIEEELKWKKTVTC